MKAWLKRFALVRSTYHMLLGITRQVWFWKSYRRFRSMDQTPRFSMRLSDRQAMLFDKTATTGFDEHYLFHTAWAARLLAEARPERHVDVGSCLRFVSLASSFVPMIHFDYRPPRLHLGNLQCSHADITALPLADGSTASLSCMHVAEHIGLGRYGDPLDPSGDLKAAAELNRVLAPGGRLYFVVPVGGRARIQFNAHRIYTHAQVLAMFPDLTPEAFALVTDSGEFLPRATPEQAAGQRYGCGCFLFAKAERP